MEIGKTHKSFPRPQFKYVVVVLVPYSLLLSFEFVSVKAHFFVLQPLLFSQHSWSLQGHHCLLLV